MTKEEMNQLADIIMDRIRSFQDELDAEFFTKVDNLEEVQKEDVKPLTTISFEEARDVLLEQYKLDLDEAISSEDYLLAKKLNKKIEDLKQ